MKTHEEYLRQAIGLADENVRTRGGGPFGCLIVREGRIIASGVNLVTTSNDPTAHAEVVAIRQACAVLKSHQLTGCIVYASCEPCPMCAGALFWARPTHVYFAATKEDAAAAGFDDSRILDQLTRSPSERRIPFTHIVLAETPVPFRSWMEDPKRREY